MPTETSLRVRRGLDPTNAVNLDVITTKSRTWYRTANFRALKASGSRLPDNPFSYTSNSVGGGVAVITDVTPGYPPGTLSWSGDRWVPTGAWSGHNPSLSSARNKAYYQALSKAKQNQWNVPIFIAEAGKTAEMVYERAVHLTTMVRHLRRGNMPAFFESFHNSVSKPSRKRRARAQYEWNKDSTKAASNLWLEYSYGWVPFMLDVRSAVNTVMDVLDKPESTVATVTGYASQFGDVEGAERVLFAYADGYYRMFARPHSRFKTTCRVTWRCSPNSRDLPARFGLINPAEVAWELIPFSFVADWFLPVGDYLAALDVPFRFTHLGGTVGIKYIEQTDWVKPRMERPANQRATKLSAFSQYVSVSRTPLTSAPIPKLNELSIGGNLGIARSLTSLGLLRQQLSRIDIGRGKLRVGNTTFYKP